MSDFLLKNYDLQVPTSSKTKITRMHSESYSQHNPNQDIVEHSFNGHGNPSTLQQEANYKGIAVYHTKQYHNKIFDCQLPLQSTSHRTWKQRLVSTTTIIAHHMNLKLQNSKYIIL